MLGFDYGTSNCAVAIMDNAQAKILPLANNSAFLPSSLYAPSRDMIVNWLFQQLSVAEQGHFKAQRLMQLQKGQVALRELKEDGMPTELFFGHDALAKYLEDPEEGYYIKSPKSFLGASGLLPVQIQLFEDIVAAMMANIKQLSENYLQREVTQTVIGRPINFQGLQADKSNQQALTVLTNAAKRVGFKEVEFQYEPVAAGFEFESTLAKESKVLVVDIGGGTTDCSMLLMGPNFANKADRHQHLLSHSGLRVGGNDFDIQLALKTIMPSFGMNGLLKSGKPVPINGYRQAVSINNINDQTEFYSASNRRFLAELIRDAASPIAVERLLKVHDEKLSYRLVNGAERAKIALTDHDQYSIELADIEQGLAVEVNRNKMLEANVRELNQIAQLMQAAVEQANCQPDVIFVTGGTAKSPVINQFIKQQMPNIPIVIGDHFGSVTSGLARWAERIYC
ncbi:molecular chaperone [Thalassotalea sp. PLHSN55]|uniref:molecular chaperone n=1 Tax=Thalassotalea sp. PLHSN55 TaxID=3435888 RepID=UPI003F842E06